MIFYVKDWKDMLMKANVSDKGWNDLISLVKHSRIESPLIQNIFLAACS